MNKKVLLLLANGFEEYEAAVFTDVMGWSRVHGNIGIDLITTALHPEIKGTWNLRILPELAFEDIEIEDYDALAVPGGFEEAGFYIDAFDNRFLSLIRAFEEQSKIIASICVGAIPLAKAGVLKNRKATTYDLDGGRKCQLGELGADVMDQRMVVDQNIITSIGPGTALDVAFKLLEMLSDAENAEQVKKYMRIPY